MKKILLLLSIVAFACVTRAQNIPDAPNPPRLVNDFVGILDAQQVADLEGQLVQFDKETSTQIVVAIVSSLDGTEASDFAFKMAEKWGIGVKGKNNGILVLVKPKMEREKGQAFIAVGYGLEGVVPDAIARRIVDNEMISRFKQKDYFGGIASGVSVLMSLTKGEFTADTYAKSNSNPKSIFFIIILIVIIIIAIVSSGANNNRNNTMGGNLPFWMLLGGLAGSSGSRGSSGGFGGFSSGGGSFGGFGGGGFGGGGAGGSW